MKEYHRNNTVCPGLLKRNIQCFFVFAEIAEDKLHLIE